MTEDKNKTKLVWMLNNSSEEELQSLVDYLESPFDYKLAFDTYYPVIEACRQVAEYYCGRTPRICADCIGEMIQKLRKAQQTMNVVKIEQKEKL